MPQQPIVTEADLNERSDGSREALVAQATAAIRRFCGWHIAPSVTQTITLDGPGGGVLALPSLYVTDVASVTSDGSLLVATDDYTWNAYGLLNRTATTWCGLPWRWSFAQRGVQVTFTHGYDLADVPDVAGVIMAKAERLASNPHGATRVQAGPFAEQYENASGFTTDEETILAQYRIIPGP